MWRGGSTRTPPRWTPAWAPIRADAAGGGWEWRGRFASGVSGRGAFCGGLFHVPSPCTVFERLRGGGPACRWWRLLPAASCSATAWANAPGRNCRRSSRPRGLSRSSVWTSCPGRGETCCRDCGNGNMGDWVRQRSARWAAPPRLGSNTVSVGTRRRVPLRALPTRDYIYMRALEEALGETVPPSRQGAGDLKPAIPLVSPPTVQTWPAGAGRDARSPKQRPPRIATTSYQGWGERAPLLPSPAPPVLLSAIPLRPPSCPLCTPQCVS